MKEIVMSDDVRDEPLSDRAVASDLVDASAPVDGPLRTTMFGRRAMLQSIAAGVGVAAIASPASAHEHQAAAPAAAQPAPTARRATAAAQALVYLDRHTYDTLAVLADQIVPGAKAAKVPEIMDRLLSVESAETQRRFLQAIGAFEQQARAAHGKPWKSLTAAQATALLTKMSETPGSEAVRRSFDFLKSGVAETYFATREGMKDLGWTGNMMFASPVACG
jgi:hypothetical protein